MGMWFQAGRSRHVRASGAGSVFGGACAAGPGTRLPNVAADDVCMIQYTSGTTGPSKGVLMPHAHCYQFGKGIVDNTEMTAEDRQYIWHFGRVLSSHTSDIVWSVKKTK